MPFPQTADGMKEAGYKFLDDAACRACGQDIEWWETPRGKKIPMDPMEKGSSAATSHWASCSDAPLFRKDR